MAYRPTPGRSGDPITDPDQQQFAEDRNRLGGLVDEMGDPSYDQGVADDYYQTVSPQIDRSFYGRSKDLASDYAKRGLSSSGMSAKAQTDESFNHAAKLRQAKTAAVNYAKNQRRQQLVDEAMMWNDWNGENAQMAGLVGQDQAGQMNGVLRLASLMSMFAGAGGGGEGGPAIGESGSPWYTGGGFGT